MNYIVSGAAGFIGFFTVQKLLQQGHTVLGVDSLNDYYTVSLKTDRLRELGIDPSDIGYGKNAGSGQYPRFRFVKAKAEDRETFFRICEAFTGEVRIDGFIHLAAQAGVRYSLENPRAYMDANISGFFNVLEFCRNIALPHLVYASSSSVYGLNTDQPFSPRRGADHPVSLYAATKRSNELMAHTYAHLYSLPVTGLRFFTVYGPWGRPDMAYYKFSKAIMEGRTIEVYNNGDMFRDFTYIDDITGGIILALNRIPQGSSAFDPARPDPALSTAPYRIYNLGNSRAERLGMIIELLEEALGKRAVKKFLPPPKGDVLATEADIEDTKQDLNWQPSTDIETGIKQFAQWFRSYHPDYFYTSRL
jgi:UDP-glucuronate 4-epimerase